MNISEHNVFSQFDIDLSTKTKIIRALGIDYKRLEDPYVFNKVKTIFSYFSKIDKPYASLLRVLDNKKGMSAIDVAFTYSELALEKMRNIERLNMEDFEEDVQKEIKNKYITKNTISRVEKDLQNKISQQKEAMRLKREGKELDERAQQAIDEANKVGQKLSEYNEALAEIKRIDEILTHY